MEELKKKIEKTEVEVEEVKALPVAHPDRTSLQARLTALVEALTTFQKEKVLLLNQAQGVVLPSVTRMRCVGLHVW